MRGASPAHILLCLLTGCCYVYPSAASSGENYNLGHKVSEAQVPYHLEHVDSNVRLPQESARSFVRGKRSIASGFFRGHRGNEKKATRLQEGSIITTRFYITTTRTHVKKRMLSRDLPFNLEPIKTFVEMITHQNGTGMVESAPWKTQGQNVLDFLPMEELGPEVGKFKINVNKTQWPSVFSWSAYMDLFKGFFKGRKNDSNPNDTTHFGDVAIINIKIFKIPKSTAAPEANMTSLGSSTESIRQLLGSSKPSQKDSNIVMKKTNINGTTSEFSDVMAVSNDFDHTLSRFGTDVLRNILRTNHNIELKQISNSPKRIERRTKHLMTALSVENDDLFSKDVGTYPNEQEEHMKNTMQRIPRTGRKMLNTSSVVTGTRVSVENYNTLSGVMGTYPNKQEKETKNVTEWNERRKKTLFTFSKDLSPPVLVPNVGLYKGIMGPFKNKQVVQMESTIETIEGRRKHLLATLSRVISAPESLEIYGPFSGVVGTFPHHQGEQMKNIMENIEIRKKQLVPLSEGISTPVLKVNVARYPGAINPYRNKHKEQMKNEMENTERKGKLLDTLSVVRIPTVSVENYELFSGLMGTYPIHEEQMKNTMENTEKRTKQLVTLSEGISTPVLKVNVDLYTGALGLYPNKLEEHIQNNMDMTDRRRKQLLDTLSVVRRPTESIENYEPFSGVTERSERRRKQLLDMLSEGRTPPVLEVNSNLFTSVIGTYPNTKKIYLALPVRQTKESNYFDIIEQAYSEPPKKIEENLGLRSFFKKMHASLENLNQNIQKDMQALYLRKILKTLVTKIKNFLRNTP